MKPAMACWFNEKWGVPLEAYIASMDECISGDSAVPQWYAAVDGERIIGGMGVIENDFHNRTDCAPNICAVYTEPEYRGRGICGALLEFVCRDMQAKGIYCLYLVTDHVGFYERYGWEFCWMVRSDGEETDSRMYFRSTALDEVYERVKKMEGVRMVSASELNEGYTGDFPILCGDGFRLYEYGGYFVFDYRMQKGNWILGQRKGKWSHSHPQDVEEAVRWIKEYIEGTFR